MYAMGYMNHTLQSLSIYALRAGALVGFKITTRLLHLAGLTLICKPEVRTNLEVLSTIDVAIDAFLVYGKHQLTR